MSADSVTEPTNELISPDAGDSRTTETRLNPHAAEFVPGQVNAWANKILNDLTPYTPWSSGSSQQEISCGPRYDSIWSESYMQAQAELINSTRPCEPHVVVVKTDDSSAGDANEEELQEQQLNAAAVEENSEKRHEISLEARGKHAGRCCDCKLM